MPDFNGWAAPPATYTPPLEWEHPSWRYKLAGGKYALLREVREACFEAHCFWPLLDETHGVPKLLDRNDFVKYCYHVYKREDLQGSDQGEYVPLAYDTDPESREEWREHMMKERCRDQYFRQSYLEVMNDIILSDEEKKVKRGILAVKSDKNQFYINVVKSCQPEAIQALFDEGTEDLCPNCLELVTDLTEGDPRGMRRGVVFHALKNLRRGHSLKKLLGEDESESYRSRAIACLRLVCSLEGVDVNADTWSTSRYDGPPLVTAVRGFDAEAVRILLGAGARTAFPDLAIIDRQWCNVVKPSEYPEAYQTAAHLCVANIEDKTRDEDISEMLKLLLEAGSEGDVLVGMPDPGDYDLQKIRSFYPSSPATPLQLLGCVAKSTGKEYPLSMAILREAEESALRANEAKENSLRPDKHTPVSSWSDSAQGEWAEITDLDETAQTSISQFIDARQWGILKQTAKSLTSWPEPPPPPYHLIRFCLSDHWGKAFFGFAKTLSGVLEALKHKAVSVGLDFIAFQFIQIEHYDQPVIPLVQYRRIESVESLPANEISNIHPVGKRHFGMKEAGGNLPENYRVKRMMNRECQVWASGDEIAGDDRSNCFKGVDFDNADDIDVFIMFDGKEPSIDIDLKKLWHPPSSPGASSHEEDMWEIWLNENRPDEGCFYYGNGDAWALCTSETIMQRDRALSDY